MLQVCYVETADHKDGDVTSRKARKTVARTWIKLVGCDSMANPLKSVRDSPKWVGIRIDSVIPKQRSGIASMGMRIHLKGYDLSSTSGSSTELRCGALSKVLRGASHSAAEQF
eukprot:gene15805-biopygen2846